MDFRLIVRGFSRHVSTTGLVVCSQFLVFIYFTDWVVSAHDYSMADGTGYLTRDISYAGTYVPPNGRN